MKGLLAVVAMVMVLSAWSTACAQWAYGPPAVAYYPPAPVVVAPVPPPVAVVPVVPAPVYVPRSVWYAAPGVVVHSKVYIPGYPVRNAFRAMLP